MSDIVISPGTLRIGIRDLATAEIRGVRVRPSTTARAVDIAVLAVTVGLSVMLGIGFLTGHESPTLPWIFVPLFILVLWFQAGDLRQELDKSLRSFRIVVDTAGSTVFVCAVREEAFATRVARLIDDAREGFLRETHRVRPDRMVIEPAGDVPA